MFANHSVHFITAYREGPFGAQASWANKRYHSHCTLPPQCILNARNTMMHRHSSIPHLLETLGLATQPSLNLAKSHDSTLGLGVK
jgi:hypothetical protein